MLTSFFFTYFNNNSLRIYKVSQKPRTEEPDNLLAAPAPDFF